MEETGREELLGLGGRIICTDPRLRASLWSRRRFGKTRQTSDGSTILPDWLACQQEGIDDALTVPLSGRFEAELRAPVFSGQRYSCAV